MPPYKHTVSLQAPGRSERHSRDSPAFGLRHPLLLLLLLRGLKTRVSPGPQLTHL